ncbi:hypothetical protein BHE74_00055428 [Ensete ventricosum]|nr:hypothetical protein GW17_00000895 [Ensete ventricosum]RWW39260.1 hypothetical protein BHE74_00055428 [Ensete ventricosum]
MTAYLLFALQKSSCRQFGSCKRCIAVSFELGVIDVHLIFTLVYECAVNIEDLIKLSDVMAEHSLGPNGGKIYSGIALRH